MMQVHTAHLHESAIRCCISCFHPMSSLQPVACRALTTGLCFAVLGTACLVPSAMFCSRHNSLVEAPFAIIPMRRFDRLSDIKACQARTAKQQCGRPVSFAWACRQAQRLPAAFPRSLWRVPRVFLQVVVPTQHVATEHVCKRVRNACGQRHRSSCQHGLCAVAMRRSPST